MKKALHDIYNLNEAILGKRVYMADEVLFEITKKHLETGMRGFPVGYCTTSSVDPQKGLFYKERAISELANWSPEDVIFLLMKGKESKGGEEFKAALFERALCSEETVRQIYQLPQKGHPMKLFSSALLILGMLEGKGNYKEDGFSMIAKLPHLAALVISHHLGKKAQKADPKIGYMESFAHMLPLSEAKQTALVPILRLFNILHYDHGGGNLSTFVGKAVASGLEDMYGSATAAMCALAGPRHGKANQDCLTFVEDLVKELPNADDGQLVESLLRKRLEKGSLLYGFGHAVLRVEDPRASIFYDYAKAHFPDHPLVKMALLLREHGVKVLKENPKITNPYPNIDAISGVLLSAAGFPHPECYTVLFGMARLVGICIQILYERVQAREGKGTPIVRPKYLYKALA